MPRSFLANAQFPPILAMIMTEPDPAADAKTLEAEIDGNHKPSKAFLPYPTSTLSPAIVPTDLTSFKSRGISQVERDLKLKLERIRDEYVATISHFNWNKLAYEADLNFEPVIGQTYHLYESRGRKMLSMIPPAQWHLKHLASLTLNVDRQFELVEVGVGVDEEELFGS